MLPLRYYGKDKFSFSSWIGTYWPVINPIRHTRYYRDDGLVVV